MKPCFGLPCDSKPKAASSFCLPPSSLCLRVSVVIKADPVDNARGPALEADVISEDASDIQASLRGDGQAYGRLISRYQDEIARQMRWFTRDPARCEELVQEVFVEAYFSLPRFAGRSPLLHWLRKIATRVGYRHLKQNRRSSERATLLLQDWDGVMTAPESASPREAAEVLHELLSRMGPRDRLVLTLMYLEEHSVAQVAALTGWTKTMVKVQAYRARRKLKKLLEQRDASDQSPTGREGY
jgi:RNA polymerase sigma-70 factor, ECF subfamily